LIRGPRPFPAMRRHRRIAAAVAAACMAVWASSTALAKPPAESKDLLVVGAGVLGRRAARLWRQRHDGAKVVACTLTETSHAALRAEGLTPTTAAALAATEEQFPYVLFSAPPGRSGGAEEYAAAVEEAFRDWSGQGGVFTSSAGVFTEDAGGRVDEASPVASTASASRLLAAEAAASKAGAAVLRLAGLYDIDRGPHSYWLKVGAVKGYPEGLINLVHYDDAAAAAAAALAAHAGEIFVVADGEPISRRGICEAALKSQRYKDAAMPSFEAADAPGGRGKILDASRFRASVGWKPEYSSFASFMAAH